MGYKGRLADKLAFINYQRSMLSKDKPKTE